ncbi:hypothetical protein DFH28DRAFT_932310 [Melampsora americana]|nr:hypothetical protein DFH28DRAFT_932310 [Melampsora americana]
MSTKPIEAVQSSCYETAEDVTAQEVTAQKTLDEVVADEVIRGVDGSRASQSDSRPALLLDLSTFSTPNLISISTSQTLSSLTPSLDQLTTPDSPIIGFQVSSDRFPSNSNYFSSQMLSSPPIQVSRPNLRHSQFSSYRTEPTSDFISYSPSGLFPHHEEPEDDNSDDDRASAQNGWTVAQRLREAALSDWESHRNVVPASPIRPVLSRNPSSNYLSSIRASQSSNMSSPSIPEQTQAQTPTRPNLYHSIRTWALQSSEATLRQTSTPVGEFPFGSTASRTALESALMVTSPSAVFASSPLAGRNTIFGSDVISMEGTSAVQEDNNVNMFAENVPIPGVSQPSPVNRTSCSPLHRHLARRSVSSSTHGLPTTKSLKQNNVTPPLITTSSFLVSSSEVPSIDSVFEEEEGVARDNPISKLKTEALQSAPDLKGLGVSPVPSSPGHLTVSPRPKTKRYKSCGEIVQQKPSLIKTSSDPLREKTLSVLGLVESSMKKSSRSSFGASVPSPPLLGHDCGRAQSPYEKSTSYFPRFVS